MGSVVRWLHLSDFHVGKDIHAQDRLFKEVLDHVKSKISSGFSPDLLFFTGDIANAGQRSEYKLFNDEVFRPLTGLLPKARAFVVPGNHDVSRPPADALNAKGLLTAEGRFFDASVEGRRSREQVTPRFKAYRSNDLSHVASNWLVSQDGTFSEQIDVAEMRVGVVGLNTAWLSTGADKGLLSPGSSLVEAALRRIDGCDVRFVLGHHPLDWLHDRESEFIQALFAKHSVLYLHGHMHKAEVRLSDNGGANFFALQAGAAFQARADEIWRNGLMWGEVDLASRELRVSPHFWNQKNLDWPQDTGRFPENLKTRDGKWWAWPIRSNSGQEQLPESGGMPKHLVRLDEAYLSSHATASIKSDAIRYFNGAEPDWGLLQSEKIGRRQVVNSLTQQLTSRSSFERIQAHLLIGPGGEGKSTALRQVALGLARDSAHYSVLWHSDESSVISAADLLGLARGPKAWLVVLDSVDLIASEIFSAVQALVQANRTDVHFLMAARESDWRTVRAQHLQWRPIVDFHSTMMSGLDRPDADVIGASWIDVEGSEVFGEVEGKTIGERLHDASQHGAEVGEGALLGGVLAIRHEAGGLRQHVESMMARFRTISLAGGATLERAFLYISAMHSEGLHFLSRPVLAEVLGCDLALLQSQVLFPLGKEAAASGGTIILTRHRRIASAAVDLAREHFGEDTDSLFEDLAGASRNAMRKHFVPEVHNWAYALPEHFMAKRPELAVRVARAVYEAERSESKLAVNLARILRETGSPWIGARELERFAGEVRWNRGFWFEWATCAVDSGNYDQSILLSALSVSDSGGLEAVTLDRAKMSLSGLCKAFEKMYLSTHNDAFLRGRSAAAFLGVSLNIDDVSRRKYLRPHLVAASGLGVQCENVTDAMSWMSAGIIAARELNQSGALRSELLAQMQFEQLMSLPTA